jgi:hypothetical protein
VEKDLSVAGKESTGIIYEAMSLSERERERGEGGDGGGKKEGGGR